MNVLTVSFLKKRRRVAWPVACNDADVLRRTVLDACELPLTTGIRIFDKDESEVPWTLLITGCIPSIKVELDDSQPEIIAPVTMVSLLKNPSSKRDKRRQSTDGSHRYSALKELTALEDENDVNVFDDEMDPDADFRGQGFQNQLTKFNRILAHLVNERTVLAWFRTNLAFVSLSFKYMKLATTYFTSGSEFVGPMLYFCGGLFAIILPFSWYSGFHRFRVCKDMIDYDITKLSKYLHKMGLDFDNLSLGLLIFFSFITIIVSCTVIIWNTEGTKTDDAT